jgi:hypothetical protein
MTLPVMPVFFLPGRYVNVPLEETYQTAYAGIPVEFREILESLG